MKLINHVLDIRRLIQQAFDNRFSRMGLRPDVPVSIESLSNENKLKRERLDEIMSNHLLEMNGAYPEARQATINECVFTLFNRIAALKVMESKELFPEIIQRRRENAGRSFEHNAWLEEHPEERMSEREGLKHFLSDQFDKLGEHIPLFRSDYPYALMPTADELNEIIDRFNAVEEDVDCGADVWKGDDILGWLYENFNSVEKEALKVSGEKTEYDKVTLQSQVYTPQWVVKFLVDNTLGKTYLEMYPDSPITEKYNIANAPKTRIKEAKDIKTLKVLDPACGSGNFLIYTFSLLYNLYIDQIENYGKDYSRREIPKMIVENNLYGIDLDERAAQITQIALFIKARDLGGHRSKWPDYTNVVSSHFYLEEYASVKDSFEVIENLGPSRSELISTIWEDLRNAYKFGSLVRVEEKVDAVLKRDDFDSLFAKQEEQSLFSFKNQFMSNLRNRVNEMGEKGSNAFTLAKTNDAISFLEIISQKYDVVVANPPYTDGADFGPELKSFVEANYKKPYKVNSNLYSCFIKRCCELARNGGKVGMIHPHTFMYIKTFEDVRRFLLDETHINVMVDYGLDRVNLFGPGILLDATFYTLDKNKQDKTEGVYFNITANQQEKFKKGSLAKAYDDYINGIPNERVYTLPQSKLKGIKSYPFIYWISDEFREKFEGKTVDDYIDVVKGLTTSDNNRFLRFWWEVNPNTISSDYAVDKKKWVRYVKGGPYNKWYGNMWTILNWENDGDEIKHFVDKNGMLRSVIRNTNYYFREGITYSAAGSKGATFRYLPANYIIDAGGPGIYSCEYKNIWYTLGLFNTKLVFYICDCLNPAVNINQGDLWRVPFVLPDSISENEVASLAKENVSIKKSICSFSMIEENFKQSPITQGKDVRFAILDYYNIENAWLTLLLLNEVRINQIIYKIYGLEAHDYHMVEEKMGIPVGDLPVSTEAKIAYKEWLQNNTEFPASEEVMQHLNDLKERTDLQKITDFECLYQSNNGWEEFCIKHIMNPVEVWYQFRNAGVLPTQRTQALAFELITDVIRAVIAKDDDGVIPLSDKMGEECLSVRIEREMMERGYSSVQFSQVCQLLGCPLDKYLQERFFQQLSDHLNLFMYLPKTPFIWHLSSGEHHALELFVSIYKWNRDSLYRVRSIYAANREMVLSDKLNSLDTSTTSGRMEAQELREQLAELKGFCDKIDDLLSCGYEPKLDDGVGKNIAPLQKRGMLSYDVLNAGQLKKYLNADW